MTPVIFAIHLLIAVLVDGHKVVINDQGPMPSVEACRPAAAVVAENLSKTNGRIDERAEAVGFACRIPGMQI